ncbi:hypothetical protein MNBD_UNCLBAC01-699 [hydrothermal vent metagenome]|uniref:DUF6036 domain-containing protein n=1 Tax=hydrothermal vent metagenome TaxID=652676 RepID=A0A3B1DG44_9ZZZZ
MKANGPGQSSLLLLDLINIFQKYNISYAVIGAFAASFYGVVRASMDADALISFDKKESGELIQELEGLGFKVIERKGSFDDPVLGVITVQDVYNNQVDLLRGIRGMDKDFFMRTSEASFQGVKIQIAGIEDFIAMKIFAGSVKDIEDVKGVFQVSMKEVDLNLLRDLTQKYGQEELRKLEHLLEQSTLIP